MDYQEAIEYFKRRIKLKEKEVHSENPDIKHADDKMMDIYNTAISAMQELKEYKKLGALEEAREAVEKQKAQEPQLMYGMYGRVYLCKKCGNEFELSSQYCPFCGQKQDWE